MISSLYKKKAWQSVFSEDKENVKARKISHVKRWQDRKIDLSYLLKRLSLFIDTFFSEPSHNGRSCLAHLAFSSNWWLHSLFFISYESSLARGSPTPWPLSESGAAKARFSSLARTAMNERQAGKKLDSKPPNTVCLFIWGSTRPGTGLRLLEVSLHDLWDRPKIIFGRYVPQRKKASFRPKKATKAFSCHNFHDELPIFNLEKSW